MLPGQLRPSDAPNHAPCTALVTARAGRVASGFSKGGAQSKVERMGTTMRRNGSKGMYLSAKSYIGFTR